MKPFLFLIYFVTLIFSSSGQIKAVTSKGDEVILYDNGTWKYLNDSNLNTSTIDTNRLDLQKGRNATFLVQSKKVNCGVYIDPKKWSFEKSGENDVSEFDFTLKGKDAYAMLISEKASIPFETLKIAALQNAKGAAPDIELKKEEYRKVNDHWVLFLQMAGSIKGIYVTYLGYYFSSPKGTVQLLAYTSTNLLEDVRPELEDLLNGFDVTD